MIAKTYEASCNGKVCYPTSKAAKTAMNKSRRSRNPLSTRPIRVYRCELCGCWHMTCQKREGYRLDVRK